MIPQNPCNKEYERRNIVYGILDSFKDRRRVAPRYGQCPKVFLSAIALAAVVNYWL